MLYLTPPTTRSLAVREAVARGLFGYMDTPAQGNILRCIEIHGVIVEVPIAADTGIFHPTQFPGPGWPGEAQWFAWLSRQVARYGAHRYLFATAPDVPFDAAGTLAFSVPWLGRIRELGIPAAFCAQNGSESPGMIPWDDIDVLFLAGDDDWKRGEAAADLAAEARAAGKGVHVGRVNSIWMLNHAAAIGAGTCDGTTVVRGPDKNGALMARGVELVNRGTPHVQGNLLGGRLVGPRRAGLRARAADAAAPAATKPDPMGTGDLLAQLEGLGA